MIVVTGATGNVGRPLVQALAEAGEPVTAVARTEGAAPEGVPFHRADLTDPQSLKPVLDGAEALFVLTSAEFMATGDLSDVMDAAKAGGVQRIVLLSSHGVGTGRHPSRLEDAVKESGLEWTMLRPGNFASNAFGWAASVRGQRTVTAPFGDTAIPAVDPADIAEVAALALRERSHGGAIYTLTGPEAISPRQQSAAIGSALGEEVRFIEQTRDQAREQMLTFLPEPVVEATLGALGEPSEVEQSVSPDVERLLGRPAGSFAAWAGRNVAAFK